MKVDDKPDQELVESIAKTLKVSNSSASEFFISVLREPVCPPRGAISHTEPSQDEADQTYFGVR
jgi:hypothetical protein